MKVSADRARLGLLIARQNEVQIMKLRAHHLRLDAKAGQTHLGVFDQLTERLRVIFAQSHVQNIVEPRHIRGARYRLFAMKESELRPAPAARNMRARQSELRGNLQIGPVAGRAKAGKLDVPPTKIAQGHHRLDVIARGIAVAPCKPGHRFKAQPNGVAGGVEDAAPCGAIEPSLGWHRDRHVQIARGIDL